LKSLLPAIFVLLACTSMGPKSLAAKDRAEVITEIAELISGAEGLRLDVHGASHDSHGYVGTYIYDNIFNAIHVSMLSRAPDVRATMATLNRHDRIRVWGRLLDLDSPQPHVSVDRIVIERKYAFPGEPHRPDVDWNALAKELEGLDTIVVEVHAIAEAGKLLVVEYKGYVFPIFNKDFSKQSESLSRQDFIKINFEIQSKPGRPIHFELVADERGQAIELLDSIAVKHGQGATLSGKLVMFPQSPSIRFNVFAIKVQGPKHLGRDLSRTYTIINFEDMELFAALREKLQTIWDDPANTQEGENCVFNDRNKLTNRCIVVEVTGTINHVDPNQANPQLLVNKIEDVKLVEQP
jgi:hypothetical protein